MGRDGKPLETKECGDCHVEKPSTEFYRRGGGQLFPECKKCTKLRAEEKVYDKSQQVPIQLFINNWER